MRVESGRREQGTLPHDAGVGANVEGTKRIFCHLSRGEPSANFEAGASLKE